MSDMRLLETLDTRELCRHCRQPGNRHRISDGKCPPPKEVPFPRLTTAKDPDAALERYWSKGPDHTFEP